ncbi:hypothetical protein ACFFF5_03830 [Lederbergia wuyishanensis]|uniref:Uncharacterized protein n=1 Tax=Lederbergia wuyishanensis TaxID=1347903 RepID=A0ABU0CZV5_9BACI|nr:hypothetical protein [Lederbergia wuyishanensis]MCJ8006290.1 hypothetical protein [Lederbergia wuyishanensis]MDQ0341659.1 hypothetical protein [Lederbergia wuyishanensis]
MSLKSIEMQVAIPRTVEAGKMSEQLQQRGQVIVEQATEEMKEKVERERTGIIETDSKGKLLLNDNKSSGQHNDGLQSKKKKVRQLKKVVANHPYKGKTIDYNG